MVFISIHVCLRISKEKLEGLWIGYQSLGMHRKQNFKLVFGFNNDLAVLTFLLPSSFTFLASLFFFCCASGFILVGKEIWESFHDLVITLYIACSRLSDSGEDTKEKDTRKVGGAKKRKRKKPLLSQVSSRFIFVFALSQFSRPDYLRAWNSLHCTMKRKGTWIVEQDFHGNFQVNITCFLPFSLASLTESYSF